MNGFVKRFATATALTVGLGSTALAEDTASFSITADTLSNEYRVTHFLRFHLCDSYNMFSSLQEQDASIQEFCSVIEDIEAEHDSRDAICEHDYDVADAQIALQAAQEGLDYSARRALESKNWGEKQDCERDNHDQTNEAIQAGFLQTWPVGITIGFRPNLNP